MQMHDVLTTVNGKPITVRDVVQFLKSSGDFRNAIYGAIEIEVIKDKARAMEITVSADELREHSEAKKRWLGLKSAQEWRDYCRWLGIDAAQWDRIARTELLRKKLQSRAVGDADIKRYFNSNREQLATVRLSRIVCASEPEAARLTAQLRVAPDDFASLARTHSIESATRGGGGYLGSLNRNILPAEVAAALFASHPGDVCGPFAENGHWTVYRVEGFDRPELDHARRAYITERVFLEWLRNEVRTASA
jgi:hypothetical protein